MPTAELLPQQSTTATEGPAGRASSAPSCPTAPSTGLYGEIPRWVRSGREHFLTLRSEGCGWNVHDRVKGLGRGRAGIKARAEEISPSCRGPHLSVLPESQ